MSTGKPGQGDSAAPEGTFHRAPTAFHDTVSTEPGARFPPEVGRYHLYVSYACPWAHRVLIARALKGLESIIGLSVVHWLMDDAGWSFQEGDGVVPDPCLGAERLSELYAHAQPDYAGRFTVPVLWDRREGTIVNNESSELLRILDTGFGELAARPEVRLSPEALLPAIDAINAPIYDRVNNGVYKCGFARSQRAYQHAHDALFETLHGLEALLSEQRWLTGDMFTEADVRLFTTLLRFDPVYHVHFKCSHGRISADFPALWAYTREIAQHPLVRPTLRLDHIRKHYYQSHRRLNPRGLVAQLPLTFDLDAPHGREKLGGQPIP